MLPEKSAPPAGNGTAVATDRLGSGGGLRLLDDGTVVLADASTGRLLRLSGGPEASLEVLARVPGQLVAAVPLAEWADAWLVVTAAGFAVFDGGPGPKHLTAGSTSVISAAVCDPAGRVWAATEEGAVLRLGGDGSVTEAAGGLTAPRGLAFSPDGTTLYVAAGPEILAVRVDPATGEAAGERAAPGGQQPGSRRLFARVPEEDGCPGGMATDGFGRLWCALWGGAAVRCFAPEGRVLLSVPLPAWQPAAVALTGRRLLVATARAGLGAPGPLDGAVLEVGCTAPVVPAGAVRLTR